MAEEQTEKSNLEIYVTSLPPIKKLFQSLISELVATFLLEYFGCLSLILDASLLQAAIGWGFIVGHIVQVFGPLSGSHINPGVSLANIVLGKMSLIHFLLYVVMQFLGALVGFLLLKLSLPTVIFSYPLVEGKSALCCTVPGDNVDGWQACVIEFFGTAFLIFIVCSHHDPRNQFFRDSFPVKVAVCITADVIAIGHLTGASLNTARTFAPALINNVWKGQWVYWVGPLSAGLITPIFYLLCFQRNVPEEEKTPTFQKLLGKVNA